MHGMKMPEGLVESQKLPEPVFTPSTKAEQGAHDENIHPDVGTSLLHLALVCRYSHPRSPQNTSYLPTLYLPPLPRARLVEHFGGLD